MRVIGASARGVTAAATLFALAAPLSVNAGPPLITDDPDTPGDGRWEINLPITLEQSRDQRTFEAPLLDINYGLGERTQLKFEVPWVVLDRRDNGTADGLGNSEIGVKYRFLDEGRHGMSMSVYPQLEFNNPTSSDERGLVDEGVRFKLPVGQRTRVTGRLTVPDLYRHSDCGAGNRATIIEGQGKMSGAAFEFENVTRTFGNHAALSAVSLRLEAGRHTAILGASGCGKTTLLRLLAGLDPPSAGQVTMNGQPASVPGRVIIPPHRRRIAMVFQDLALWPNLHVIDNVGLALSGTSLSRKEVRRRSMKALESCRIADLAARKPGELSGGQQQRVALARAIAARPDFLLLDEPFAGLDLLTRDYFLAQIRDLANTIAFTVVLVTHDPADAALLCSHAIVMEEGHVAEVGALPDLFQNAKSQLLRRFRQHQDRLS